MRQRNEVMMSLRSVATLAAHGRAIERSCGRD
jgi:hypothetical protein